MTLTVTSPERVQPPYSAYVLRQETGYSALVPALGLTAHAPTWWAVRRALVRLTAEATGLSPDTEGLLSWAPERRSEPRQAVPVRTHAA